MKARWRLDCTGAADETVTHVATPDGCVELIWRRAGRSSWNGDQPEAFMAGIITAPTPLLLSGDSAFLGLRIWPWAWSALGGAPVLDGWRPMPAGTPDTMAARLAPLPANPVGAAILRAASVAGLATLTGRPHRWLQRWFARHAGLPPRTYLRLLRFQDALEGLQRDDGSLADHAAAHGFADQPHMAREFRAMAGLPANAARRRARGPFV